MSDDEFKITPEPKQDLVNLLDLRIIELEGALRYGIGAALNEMRARGLPLEWAPNSGIGKMLLALECESTEYDEWVERVLRS